MTWEEGLSIIADFYPEASPEPSVTSVDQAPVGADMLRSTLPTDHTEATATPLESKTSSKLDFITQRPFSPTIPAASASTIMATADSMAQDNMTAKSAAVSTPSPPAAVSTPSPPAQGGLNLPALELLHQEGSRTMALNEEDSRAVVNGDNDSNTTLVQANTPSIHALTAADEGVMRASPSLVNSVSLAESKMQQPCAISASPTSQRFPDGGERDLQATDTEVTTKTEPNNAAGELPTSSNSDAASTPAQKRANVRPLSRLVKKGRPPMAGDRPSTTRNHRSALEKELKGLQTDMVVMTSPRKTRQQRAKEPNAAAAVRRRRSGLQ